MVDDAYRPTFAAPVVQSAAANGDLITDLRRLACQMAVATRREVSEADARQVAEQTPA